MVADFDAELMHVELKYFSETITTGILHFFLSSDTKVKTVVKLGSESKVLAGYSQSGQNCFQTL